MQFRRKISALAFCLCVVAACAPGGAQSTSPQQKPATPPSSVAPAGTPASTAQPKKELREPDVIYVPTPPEVVDAMLKIANVKKGDVLYDLGSGDGRIVITAAKEYGIERGVGIDINPQRIAEANENAQKAGVTDRVKFINEDLFETDFSDATVVMLYLLPELNLKLRPKLWSTLKPGTRIVSHAFNMGDWQPEKTITVNGSNVYFWVVPERTASKN